MNDVEHTSESSRTVRHEPLEFESINLYDELLAADVAVLDSLPFGVIVMGDDHRVVFYNRAESVLSGLTPDRVVGRHFFSEVAPCTNNFMVAYRFETEEPLDAMVEYVFTLRMNPTPVRLRLLRRAGVDRRFHLVQRI